MKTENKSHAEKLGLFSALYENAKNAYSDTLSLFDKYMRQYRGSTEIDGSSVCATTVRNITYEIVESQVSSDIPQPKVDSVFYTETRERNAQAIERLCRSARASLPFDELNDLDERFTYIYGGSVWFVEWDDTVRTPGGIGDVKVHLISPRDFIPQPDVYTIEDMEYCFIRFTTTRAGLIEKYGIDEEKSLLAECESENGAVSSSDTVNLILAFYKNENGDIGLYAFSGSLVLDDSPRYYKRKLRYCRSCGLPEGVCSCGTGEFKEEEIDFELVGDPRGREPYIKVPYYTPRRFPIVIRKNTSTEKCLLGQSDCEYLRPEQQAINKIESRILEKLLRAGITPIVPEDASISLNNSVFGQLIKMKPGESASQYGKVDTTPDISQDIAEAGRLYDHAKRTLGISDAFQGISESANESGYARQLRISQASGRLESKRRMKNTAYASIDRLIFELYLAFADERRALSYKDGLGRVHEEAFSRFDFLEYDSLTGEWRYDSSYLFSIDTGSGNEYQREALWQRNLENLRSGTLGDVASPETLYRYWQAQERAHYPFARDNVEYFKDIISKGEPNELYAER